jgi:rare lipoprotein A (peptidoglycan hydrolase)
MVRVNDRGPFIGQRFLDLPWAGAAALGIDGVAEVTAEICVGA